MDYVGSGISEFNRVTVRRVLIYVDSNKAKFTYIHLYIYTQ